MEGRSRFDLTISFDKAEYMNPQLYMLVDTLKGNLPKDTVLHITTNRENDEVIEWIQEQIPTKIYNKPTFDELKCRCKYMLHAFEIETDKDWVIKIENDILALQHLRKFNRILDKDYDIVLHTENRRVIPDDSLETRIWRNIYRAMKIKLPDIRLPYVENKEVGRPLLHTAVVCVQSKHLDTINERWVPLTKICENWIQFNIHPNEFAFTGMIFDEGWNFKIFNSKYNFNPIGHFRDGEFPSTNLIDTCKLPSDTVLLHYHRPQWLSKLSICNSKISEIVTRNSKYIPDNWWDESFGKFQESN